MQHGCKRGCLQEQFRGKSALAQPGSSTPHGRLPMLFQLASFFADRTSRKHPWTSCCMLPHHLTMQHLEQLLVLRQQRRRHQQQEQQQQQ